MIFNEWIDSLKSKFIEALILRAKVTCMFRLISAKFELHKDAGYMLRTDGDLMQIVRNNRC